MTSLNQVYKKERKLAQWVHNKTGYILQKGTQKVRKVISKFYTSVTPIRLN